MTTQEKTLAIVQAQAELTLHIAERVQMLQVTLEAFVAFQIKSDGADDKQFAALRQEVFLSESQTTARLLHTLRATLDRIDTETDSSMN